MAKQIFFSDNEIKLLSDAILADLNVRSKSLNIDKPHIETIEKLESVRLIIAYSDTIPVMYAKVLARPVSVYLKRRNQSRIDYYNNLFNVDLLNLTKEQQLELTHLGDIVSLYKKVAPESNSKNPMERTEKYGQFIEGLKEPIYYTGSQGPIYKVGWFLSDGRFVQLDIGDGGDSLNEETFNIRDHTPDPNIVKQEFGSMGGRKVVLELLEGSSKEHKLTPMQLFTCEVLRKSLELGK